MKFGSEFGSGVSVFQKVVYEVGVGLVDNVAKVFLFGADFSAGGWTCWDSDVVLAVAVDVVIDFGDGLIEVAIRIEIVIFAATWQDSLFLFRGEADALGERPEEAAIFNAFDDGVAFDRVVFSDAFAMQ